ncbi:dihydrofolate reductase [Porcipelethomonas sp.]|uniref:dihydrofolate reductase n=1 Tax=Porcipelethomonas sp. TaxID=2981675 RepID=UPI003EFA3F59
MIAIIAAFDRNRVIGKNGRIPWSISGEQSRFRVLTTGNAVIMGRRTYEEIGKPLPDRINIIVSGTRQFTGENCYTVSSLPDAIALAGDHDIFISGGAALYAEALPMAEKMYITEIDAEFEGDTFFPDFSQESFIKETIKECSGEFPYTYVTYTRR